ncbi:MAG: hypothetical protein RL710_2062 [Pseudomonadota bacterium]
MNKSTSDGPASLTPRAEGYADLLADLKGRIHSAQQRATLAVNRELVAAIVQQAVGQLPWGLNLLLLTQLKGRQQRLAKGDDRFNEEN